MAVNLEKLAGRLAAEGAYGVAKQLYSARSQFRAQGIGCQTAEVPFVFIPEGAEPITLTIGGETHKELIETLLVDGYQVSSDARRLMENPKFVTLKDGRRIYLIKTPLWAMGFTAEPQTDQIFARASDFGWFPCPAEGGPRLRIASNDQPFHEAIMIGMESINKDWSMFEVVHDDDGLWLDTLNGKDNFPPGIHRWDLGWEFVFSLEHV